MKEPSIRHKLSVLRYPNSDGLTVEDPLIFLVILLLMLLGWFTGTSIVGGNRHRGIHTCIGGGQRKRYEKYDSKESCFQRKRGEGMLCARVSACARVRGLAWIACRPFKQCRTKFYDIPRPAGN
jgi:hypothetical protein